MEDPAAHGASQFPYEIWQHIFRFVPASGQTCICLCSELFLNIAQPLLFREIEIDKPDAALKFIAAVHALDVRTNVIQQTRSFHLDLKKLDFTIVISSIHPTVFTLEDDGPEPTMGKVATARAFPRRLAPILGRMTHLEELHLRYGSDPYEQLVEALGEIPRSCKLRTFWTDARYSNAERLQIFLNHATSLKELSLFHWHHPNSDAPPKVPTLERLTLIEQPTRPPTQGGVEKMFGVAQAWMKACVKLEKVKVVFANQSEPPREWIKGAEEP